MYVCVCVCVCVSGCVGVCHGVCVGAVVCVNELEIEMTLTILGQKHRNIENIGISISK